MPFPWLKYSGKVIPVCLRRPTKNRHSTATDHEGHSYIPAGIPAFPSPTISLNSSPVHPVSASGDPGLQVPTNVYSTRCSQGVSLARVASDMAQLALPFVQAFTGIIPIVGAPMKAAIGGLLEILQAIDVRACVIARMILGIKGHHRDAIRTAQI
ncbi:uncharacterized protein EDB91DRAFT_1250466 [Suillus paluster]|uniref:uncharacterized protein n=1 Tax=Suillus paluster TaxID=48578 RepID=UPI001B86F88B|nr:uncharacterized protein EDB91DRAFT_1250466 [Suillus paluster]KAG1735634.1 hypothetical protein EDB91DRAFT_1250466 [Suillus paluster]